MAPSRALTSLRPSLHSLAPKPTHPSSTPRLTRPISTYGYTQSKSLVISTYGEPQKVLSLHSASLPPPHSSLLTLRFLASPINPADINQIQGVYPSKPTFSTTLGTSASGEPLAVGGNEGVAEVIATGPKVKRVQKGDWVIMKRQGFGTWRTHAQTQEDMVTRIEDKSGLRPEQVGTVSVNPMTAWRMLRDYVDLREGEWFIQNGANSGVGRAAIQLGRLWGFKSLNVIRARRSEEETERLKEELRGLGADVVVTDQEVEDKGFRERVKEWTDGGRESIRLGFNCVGGSLVNSMAKHLSAGSHMVTYGAMSRQPVSLPTGLLIFKQITFSGIWVSKWSNENPEEKDRCVQEVLNLTRQGKFQDIPMDAIRWNHDTKQDELVDAVQGTLEGYRSGKGIFLFGDT